MSRRQTRVGPSKWVYDTTLLGRVRTLSFSSRVQKAALLLLLPQEVASKSSFMVRQGRWRWDILFTRVDQSEILRFDSVSSCAVEVPQTFVPPNLSLLSILLGAKHGPQAPPTLNEVNLGEQVYLPEREKKKYRGSVKSARLCIDASIPDADRDLGTSGHRAPSPSTVHCQRPALEVVFLGGTHLEQPSCRSLLSTRRPDADRRSLERFQKKLSPFCDFGERGRV